MSSISATNKPRCSVLLDRNRGGRKRDSNSFSTAHPKPRILVTLGMQGAYGEQRGRNFFLDFIVPHALNSNHTGFDGCDAVEPDSPMYITLPKNREA